MIFLKCDIDKNKQLAKKYDVKTIPTFIIFRDGEPLETLNGWSAASLEALIRKCGGKKIAS